MPDGGGGGAAHHDLTRMSLAVLNEGGHVGDAVGGSPLGVDGDGRSVGVDAADRIVVLIGVIGHFLRLVARKLEGDHAHGVAVRIGIGDGLVAGNAGSAGQVVDGQGHAQLLVERFAEGTQAGIGAAAGAPRANDGNAFGRILGRGRDGRQAHHENESNRQSKKLFHRVFLLKCFRLRTAVTQTVCIQYKD